VDSRDERLDLCFDRFTSDRKISLSTAYTLHGVAAGVQLSKFAYRNVSEKATLEAILRTRAKFVPLDQAIAGNGDALTVDDATRASADAALLARQYGHAVTLFVNPGQIESGETYSFLSMAVLLDSVESRTVRFESEDIPFRSARQKNALRERLKVRLRATATETERIAFVNRLAEAWGVNSLTIPAYLKTLTMSELRSLAQAGVDIQNHGWFHDCHENLSTGESVTSIEKGRRWLRENLNVDARYFAVPYGDTMPKELTSVDCDLWLTVDHRLPPGMIGDKILNRETLEAPPPLGTIETIRRRARRSMRILRKRLPLYGGVRPVK
jgi:peptidoglycan/xylan/chitin deacetylase (PgdA/CDA1 family)